MIQGGSLRATRFIQRSLLMQHSFRSLADRSHRIAGLAALAGAQQYKAQAGDFWHPFMQRDITQVRERDMSKQILLDLRSNDEEYKKGHIIGAVNLDREKLDFLKYVDTRNGLTFDEVYNAMRNVGVSNDTSEIILYDNDGESACRLWYVLRYFGFANVRILNGGFQSWLLSGIPVETDENIPKPSKTLSLKPSRSTILTRPTQMMENVQHERSKYIDTRPSSAFEKGAIPRAINIPSEEFMDDARFMPIKQIRNVCMNKGLDSMSNDQHIILYSTMNLSACVAYFCMSMAGYDRIAVYDQGYENWQLNKERNLTIDQEEALKR